MCLSLVQECWEIPLLTTSFTPAMTPPPGGEKGRQDERAGDSLGRADTALAERGCLQLGPAWPSSRSLSCALSLGITLASFALVLQCLWLSVLLTTCSDSAITCEAWPVTSTSSQCQPAGFFPKTFVPSPAAEL